MTSASRSSRGDAGYGYGAGARAAGSAELIRESLRDYLRGELGWGEEAFRRRLDAELEREIPRSLFDGLEARSGWTLPGRRLLDVGSGQGGALQEALERGADGWGVEPSRGFGRVARVRLREAGHAPARVVRAVGERLPFPDASFDYVVSLQVLEHVAEPARVVAEIERVLKPGGRCWISCENYLAFREQHYRVAWLPLLPKALGAAYLRARGRKPEFLKKHVTYVTYPAFESMIRGTRLANLSRERALSKLADPSGIGRPRLRRIVRLLTATGVPLRPVGRALLHLRNLFRVGIRSEFEKRPAREDG